MTILGRRAQLAGAVALGFLLTTVSGARAAVYEVGDGKRFRNLGAVPWTRLAPGDTVRIHWRKEPYREKLLLGCRGTATKPIRIVGIPGPAKQRPVIDGLNATTSPQFVFHYPPTQDRGLVIVTPAKGQRWGYKPGYLHLEGLEVRGAYRGEGTSPNTFKDGKGATRSYTHNAAAIFVERGEHIVIRNCTITNSGNGLFVASGGSEEVQSRDILVDGCLIHGNGNVGRDREHNVYTEAIGITFQYNRFGKLRPKALGGNLKDRSAGTVIRYNWIEDGARVLDLVEAQESIKLAGKQPSYSKTFVYGNVLVDGPEGAVNIVHYGGDNGNTPTYRKGTLYFFNNTVVIQADQKKRWRTVVFQLSTNEEKADVRNNIIYRTSATPGAAPTELTLVSDAGYVDLGVNWISPGWIRSRSNAKFQGTIKGAEKFLIGRNNVPGFANAAKQDFHLVPRSPCIDKGEMLPSEVTRTHPLNRQYKPHLSGEKRGVAGRGIDLGAFEYSSQSVSSRFSTGRPSPRK
jgi:hypothetical protein